MSKIKNHLAHTITRYCFVLLSLSVFSLLGIALFFGRENAYSQTTSASRTLEHVFALRQCYLNLKQNKPEQALLEAQKATELYKLSAEAYFCLARAEQDIGLKSDALRDYGKAIFLDKNFAKAYSNRGLVKASLGDKQGALSDFNQAINIDKKFATGYLNRGVLYGALGASRASLDDFNKALQLNTRYVDAYRNRGIAKELLGDNKGACIDWKMAQSLGDNDAKQWVFSQCKNYK